MPMRPTEQTILGVDLGCTRLKRAVLGPGGPAERGVLPTPRGWHGEVLELLRSLVQERGGDVRVGLAVPGPAPRAEEEPLFVPNLPGEWHDVTSATIAASLRVPLEVTKDADAFALGELRFGAARGTRDAAFFTLGTGVGGAIAVDGRVHRGRGGWAGALGHVTVRGGGAPCVCGSRGCLEAYTGERALLASASAPTVEELACRAHDGDAGRGRCSH
jgi:glucokinase